MDVSLCVKEMGSLKESLMRRVTCNTRETREVSESDCKGHPRSLACLALTALFNDLSS